ncbi:trypsin-like serine peptidase [Roseospira goensis]|uniref:Serine protease n=1 Tax=Roseospira goensis TaxID=391922 RepID=A0A7W6WLB1_9PROT|nr:trypsin-like peptidase domain-containing protein [Roseospira goensis]MBB4286950.1 V8-like Glu-specific endopeptidase [Roseospira goensis]
MTYQADDDQYPARAVVFIESTWGTQTFTGTGFLVGRNDIVTASHVLYDQTLGGTPDYVRVAPSYEPGAPDNVFYDDFQYHYYPDFDPDGDGLLETGDLRLNTLRGSEYDMALISLREPVGDVYGWFGVDPGFSGGAVGLLGHPALYGRALMYDGGSVWHHSQDSVLYYNNDLEVNPGNSGGPVYYDYGDGPFAVGVVSTGLVATSFRDHWWWISDVMTENDALLADGSAPDDDPPSDPFDSADIAVFNLMLGRPPDDAIAAEVSAAAWSTVTGTAAVLSAWSEFQGQFSGLSTLGAKIDVIVVGHMGLSPQSAGYAGAVDYFESSLTAGRSVPDVMAEAVLYLLDDARRQDAYDGAAATVLESGAGLAAPLRLAGADAIVDDGGVAVVGARDPAGAALEGADALFG